MEEMTDGARHKGPARAARRRELERRGLTRDREDRLPRRIRAVRIGLVPQEGGQERFILHRDHGVQEPKE